MTASVWGLLVQAVQTILTWRLGNSQTFLFVKRKQRRDPGRCRLRARPHCQAMLASCSIEFHPRFSPFSFVHFSNGLVHPRFTGCSVFLLMDSFPCLHRLRWRRCKAKDAYGDPLQLKILVEFAAALHIYV